MPDWDSLDGDAAAKAVHRRINQTGASFPEHSGVVRILERRVEHHPNATALVHRDRSLSYRELNGRANMVAARLRAAGVRAGEVVGVRLERSPELVVALLAVLKCGAAYLPFDPSWPSRRLRQLSEVAGCRHTVDESFVDDAVGQAPDPGLPVGGEAIAYINFTSGSTGTPKGVPVRHSGVVRLLHDPVYVRLDSRTTVLHLSPATFDAATFEIWGPLLHGGTCVLYPSKHVTVSGLRRVLTDHGVTVVFLTTALFNTIIDEAPDALDRVDSVLTGGEAHSLKHIRKALERYGPGRLVSVYGPTECTTFASYYPIREVSPDDSALPIGLPIQNTRLYIADGDRLCGPGEIGEVLLAGPGLSPGYLGMPEATADRFITRMVDGRAERLYRTGDRAWLREDGNAVFHGRLDDQVKVNGYRIELGEVAHHLQQHPDVKQCFVTVGSHPGGSATLLGFVVPVGETSTAAHLRDFLAGRLPGYMIPSGIHFVRSLPLTATGKIDRAVLLAEVAS